jgi:hypothetical protein
MEVIIRSPPPKKKYRYKIYITHTHEHTHTHVHRNRPHVSPRLHIRLNNLVAWTIKTFEWQ